MNHIELVKFLLDNEFENIKGYEDLYKINKKGEIWSCYCKKIMKPFINEDNYYYVSLRDINKKKHNCRIHRLLGLQYIPNPENKNCIDHIDRNRQNNNLENLRWYSNKENCNNIEKGKGCIFIDKSTREKTGKTRWRAQHSLTIDGYRKKFQKSSYDKKVVEDWLQNIIEKNK